MKICTHLWNVDEKNVRNNQGFPNGKIFQMVEQKSNFHGVCLSLFVLLYFDVS